MIDRSREEELAIIDAARNEPQTCNICDTTAQWMPPSDFLDHIEKCEAIDHGIRNPTQVVSGEEQPVN